MSCFREVPGGFRSVFEIRDYLGSQGVTEGLEGVSGVSRGFRRSHWHSGSIQEATFELLKRS